MLQAGLRPASGFRRFRFTAPFSRRPRVAVVGIGVGHFRDYDGLPGRKPRHFRAYSPFARTFVRSFVLNTARAHHNRVPSRQKGRTLAARRGGLGAEHEGAPPAPYQTVSRARLPVRPVAVPKPYLGALKYHVVAAAPTAARPPPHRRACPSVLRRPLRDALPPRSLAHLPPDVRGRRARDSPDLRAHLRPP